MTEPKEDIQAQIDQLDERWAAQVRDRKQLAIFLVVYIAIVIYVQGWREVLGSATSLLYIIPIVLLVNQYKSSQRLALRKSADNGVLTASSYKSSRTRLQAKLDALD